MKNKTMWFWVIFTSALLLLNSIASQLGISYTLLLALTAFGCIVVIGLVYKVLTAKYKPRQTFDDWYKENIA